MTLRVKLDAGEHRTVSFGAVPSHAVINIGDGAVLVEGRLLAPGQAWTNEYDATCCAVSALDATTIEAN